MSKNLKTALQYAIAILVGGFFIYLVFNDTDWADLFMRIKSANLNWLLLGLAISILSHFIRAYRATMLYHAMGYPVGSTNSFFAVLIGYMANYAIPRAGEVARCAVLKKTDEVPIEKSLGSVITERIVDMLLLVLILAAIFLLQFDLIVDFISKAVNKGNSSEASALPLKWILVGGTIIIATLLFMLRKKLRASPMLVKLFDLFEGFGDGLLSIRHLKNPVLFIILSIAIWVCYILMMYFCLFAMEPTSHLSFIDCLTVFAIGTIGIVLPAPGAGAGTYHFFIIQSLLLFGVGEADGKAYATMVHGSQMILLLVLGAIASVFVLLQKKKTIANEQAQ